MAPSSNSPVAEAPAPLRRRFSQVLRVFGDLHFHTDGEVLAVAFSAANKFWSVEESGVLRQWDASSGQQLGWVALSNLATAWRFSGGARLLASASDEVTVWEVASARLLAALPQPSWVTALAFHPDGHVLATGSDDGVIRVWDPVGHQLKASYTGHEGAISALAWRADGVLASAAEDRAIQLWDADGQPVSRLEGHTDRVISLAWDPQSRRLASAGWDTTVRLWDTASAEPIILLNAHAEQVTALAFHPKGTSLASADSSHALYLWDAVRYELLFRHEEHRAEVTALAFNVAGDRLVSGGADGLLHVWDTSTGDRLSSQGEAALDRVHLALTPDGALLASTCGGNGLRIWETETGRPVVETGPAAHGHVLSGSPDGRWLATSGADRCIRLYEAVTASHYATLTGPPGPAAALAFTPDSKRLASASSSDATVWVWHIPSGEPCLVIPEAADNCMVESLAFHPAGRLLAVGGIDWLATAGSDGAVRIWDVEQPGPVITLDGATTALAFHPSGRWMVGASLREQVWIWDVKTFQRIAQPAGHLGHVTCVAFSPDGRWLASGSDDRSVRLWHTFSWKPAARLELPSQIKALTFSPDSRLLYTGNGNTTSYQLDVQALAVPR